MTVSNTISTITLAGDGSNKVFSYNFMIPYQDNGTTPAVLVQTVSATGTTVTIPANQYTITGVNNPSGGTVTYPLSGSAIAAGTFLKISRNLAITQNTAVPNTSFYPNTVEKIADRLVYMMQQLNAPVAQSGGTVVGALLSANNLSDVANVTTARANLGATGSFGNVNDYLLPGDTNYDGAFLRALAANNTVYVPAKPTLGGLGAAYAITAPITLSSKQALWGDGSGVSVISSNAPGTAVIVINPNIYSLSIRGVTVTHSVTATAGGDGIQMAQGATNWVDQSFMEDVFSRNNYIGFNLGKAYYSTINACSALGNVSDGFRFTSTGVATVVGVSQPGPLQWYLQGCVSQQNGGSGYAYLSTATGTALTYSISVGALTNCATFANAVYGISVIGTDAGPIYSLRVEGGFYGADLNHEIYVDSRGNGHVIRPTMIELAGNPSGSSTACGIYITGNGPGSNNMNNSTLISVGHINGCKAEGIFTAAPDTTITGGAITNNGLGLVASRRNGITFFTGSSGIISGVRICDRGAGTQQYGISANVDELCITGCDLRGNLLSPIALPAIVNTVITGCRPTSINSGGGSANTVTGNLTVSGSITAGTGITVTAGGINAGGAVTGVTTLNASGNITAAGMNASGNVNAGTLTATGNIVSSGGDISATTGSLYATAGGVITSNAAFSTSVGVGTGASAVTGRIDIAGGAVIGAPTGGYVAGTLNSANALRVNNAIVTGFSGTYTGNVTITGNITATGSVTGSGGLVSSAGVAAGGPITGATTILASSDIVTTTIVQAGTDLISNGTTHLNGAIALNGAIFVTSGNSMTLASGGITATNIQATASIGAGASATGITGRISVSNGIDKSGTLYNNP